MTSLNSVLRLQFLLIAFGLACLVVCTSHLPISLTKIISPLIQPAHLVVFPVSVSVIITFLVSYARNLQGHSWLLPDHSQNPVYSASEIGVLYISCFPSLLSQVSYKWNIAYVSLPQPWLFLWLSVAYRTKCKVLGMANKVLYNLFLTFSSTSPDRLCSPATLGVLTSCLNITFTCLSHSSCCLPRVHLP